jgi:hypothetical protein
MDHGMKISRTPEITRQVQEADVLKTEIIRRIKAELPEVLLNERERTSATYLIKTLELSAESFDLVLERQLPSEMDRTASMLSGPFFTSTEFPAPTSESALLYPIVQIDLRAISALMALPLGDGLLQLWYRGDEFEGEVIVVPRSAVVAEAVTVFPVELPDGPLASLPLHWSSDPLGDGVLQIVGLRSTGVQCQDGHVEMYCRALHDKMSPELLHLLTRFRETATFVDSIHMFGTFYPIHYSSDDVCMRCLFNIPDWGPSGCNAQVFYNVEPDGSVDFSFMDTVR